MKELLNSISIIIQGITIVILAHLFNKEQRINASHWKATEHELNMLWDKVNDMAGEEIEID